MLVGHLRLCPEKECTDITDILSQKLYLVIDGSNPNIAETQNQYYPMTTISVFEPYGKSVASIEEGRQHDFSIEHWANHHLRVSLTLLIITGRYLVLLFFSR